MPVGPDAVGSAYPGRLGGAAGVWLRARARGQFAAPDSCVQGVSHLLVGSRGDGASWAGAARTAVVRGCRV